MSGFIQVLNSNSANKQFEMCSNSTEKEIKQNISEHKSRILYSDGPWKKGSGFQNGSWCSRLFHF
jgi:hypothetical protein